jgi:hypothetical protein
MDRLERMRQINAPNFGNWSIEAILKNLADLVEKSDIQRNPVIHEFRHTSPSVYPAVFRSLRGSSGVLPTAVHSESIGEINATYLGNRTIAIIH